jgi:hypothetical protein
VVGERATAAASAATAPDQEKKLFPCSECDFMTEDLGQLGEHLEAHREVTAPTPPTTRGKPTSAPCSKGCGRHFPFKHGRADREQRQHEQICDGRPPIVAAPPAKKDETGTNPKEEAVAKKAKCSNCGEMVSMHPPARARHLKRCTRGAGAGEKSREEKEPLVVVDKDQPTLPIRDRVIAMLELEEERLSQELGRTKAMLRAVRDAAPDEGGGDTRPTNRK